MFTDSGSNRSNDGLGRIAIYSHTHPSLTSGGAEIAAYALFRGLRTLGHDAIFVAACEEARLDQISLGADEFALPVRSEFYDHFYHIAPPDVRMSLVLLLQAQNVSVLNAHHFLHIGVGALADVAAAGIRVAFTYHEYLAVCHNHGQLVTRPSQMLCAGPSPTKCQKCYPDHSRQQFAIRQQHVAGALDTVAAFISPSRFLADRMIEQGFSTERFTVIENGVATGAAMPDRRHQRDIWRFGYFGQINPFKGVDVLLDACAILARDPSLASRLRIAVHGTFVGQPHAFVERFQAAVEEYAFLSYLGPYDNGSVTSLMADCDYVVMPSTWWENSPVVIQEAYRARRPVICTGIGGMAEKVVDGETGLHFARNDPADLADRIAFAADEALHSRLQAALPQPLTPIDMAERYAAVFREVTNTAVAAAPAH
ncbi:D-inositol 3-phosphate glycosyltransferase [Sphingomonas dokdonensis]|uniref:D-inositol 3-phosphate glycosyltransferase n=1 Tax=Sphingomonas dokdonensis TaxID=344880 RepID=A0A245ZVB3_9SPHN|nr:D-inositol 3-phosphate glycosyltransferase [Sphingomonas dokdonensis]